MAQRRPLGTALAVGVLGVAAHAVQGLWRPIPGLSYGWFLVLDVRDAGATVHLDDRVADPGAAPDTTGRAAYRVVQEALTNARRHAPGEAVHVRVDGGPGDGLVIEIRNRLGDDPTGEPGSGLTGLTERAELVGGRLTHGVIDREFRLHAVLPWPP